jgi:hypothetical protein
MLERRPRQNTAQMKGLSLYRATDGLLRSTRHALIGDLPV